MTRLLRFLYILPAVLRLGRVLTKLTLQKRVAKAVRMDWAVAG